MKADRRNLHLTKCICVSQRQGLIQSATKMRLLTAPDSIKKEPMPHAPHILVVDDHQQIRDSVTRYLEKNGMRATAAKDAMDMDAKLSRGHFDLLVLDVMMPGESGLSVCQRLSVNKTIPIIMLTALGEETDRIVGLEIGADDYLAKPFNPRELLARIKAVLRRAPQSETVAGELAGKRVAFGHLVLDVDRQVLEELADQLKCDVDRQVLLGPDGAETLLTYADFKLLSVLLERPRVVLSREQLLDLTQGRAAGPLDRTIDNQISRLRRKVEPDILRPKTIKTIRNGGYCLSVDVEVSD